MSKELTKNVANNVVNTNSQHLTEKWRNGTLEEDFYYVKNKSCLGVEIDYYNVLHSGIKYWSGCEDEDVEEVLAPVPTYEEWVKNGTWYTEKSHNKLIKKVEQLEKQLNEANEVIKKYRRFEVALKVEKGTLTGVYPAVDYLKKWGLK